MHQQLNGVFRCFLCAVTVTAISFFTLAANSGEVLKLKAGTISLESKSSRSVRGFKNSGEFVVQFNRTIKTTDKKQLQKLGLKVLNYLPDDALVVYGSGEAATAAQALSAVRAIQEFLPEWKVSDKFTTASVFTQTELVTTHIRLSHKSFNRDIQMDLARRNLAAIRYVTERVIIADVRLNDISAIAVLPGVEWLEPVAEITNFDFDPGVAPEKSRSRVSYTGYESGTKVIGFESAWSRGFEGAGETAAMADTGLDTGDVKTLHKDLGNTKAGQFISGTTFPLPFSWKDTNGHGTHVAGSIVGNGSMSGGNIQGGARKAAFFAEGIGIGDILNPLALQAPKNTLDPAIAQKASIHSNSWGSDAQGAYDAMAVGYDDYTWNNPDLLVVFAAGNSGIDANKDGRIDEGSIGSPATAKNVLTVGASENYLLTGGIQRTPGDFKPDANGNARWAAEPIASDKVSNNPDGLAMFSSRGPTDDGRIKPDIVAPGTNIVSTRSSMIKEVRENPDDPNSPIVPPLWGVFDASYLYCGGTSMATPVASGAATVTREYLVKKAGLSTPSAAMIKATMMHTAHDMYPGQYGTGSTQELPTRRPNVHEGYGRVDMDKLTNSIENSKFIDDKSGVGVDEEKLYTIRSVGGVTATLVYTDAPGTASAATALVNDIDITVVDPNGKVFTKADRKNNNEIIEITDGAEGEYKIKVKGINVPTGKNGKQPYALVLSTY